MAAISNNQQIEFIRAEIADAEILQKELTAMRLLAQAALQQGRIEKLNAVMATLVGQAAVQG